MSAETKAALDTALAAHIADEGDGAFLTGYVLLAAAVPSDGSMDSTRYLTAFAENQPYHSAYGLAHQLVDGFDLAWSDDD